MANTYIIDQNSAGQRIDNYLIKVFKTIPKTRMYRAIRKGEVRVDKKRVKNTYKVQLGDCVRVPPQFDSTQIPSNVQTKQVDRLLQHIIFSNDDVLVLNKPAGLAVHGGTGINSSVIDTLRALETFDYIELVHRLDRETSGCLLLAKHRAALLEYQSQLSSMTKRYWCLVDGKWQHDEIEVTNHLSKLSDGKQHRAIPVNQGKYSRTQFRLLSTNGRYSLVEAKLLTGRMHQIRAHLQQLNYAIVGDKVYNSRYDHNTQQRMYLHARSLTIPVEQQPLQLTASLDRKFYSCLTKMNLLPTYA